MMRAAMTACRRRLNPKLLLPFCVWIVVAARAAAEIPSPEAHFGFRMGEDGRLASWQAIEAYFSIVAAASDRVELVEAGPTTDGNRIIAAIVSAPRHIARLSAIQAANRRLADPRTVSSEEAARIAADQPVIVAIGCSIHATEIGATQAANELLHTLATASDPSTLRILDEVVLVLFPSLNPDGHRIVVDWFETHRGTPFEAGPIPWLYHKYVGHDINRDAFMMNMVENRTLARFFYARWHPQVFLTMHQMGSRGPRFFVPPVYDPIDPNYDPLIWRQAGLLGHGMAIALERDDRSGVVSNALFDYYWPGYEDSAPLGHNTVCLLSEVASARLAQPITVSPGELTGSARGLPQYRVQQNFPNPWPGGTWRLRDIIDYNLSAARGLLDAAGRYREQLVQNFFLMGSRAIERGRAGGPFAFLIPPDQHDPLSAARLTELLLDGAVEVHRATAPFRADGTEYPAGTELVLMNQPFRAYAKTLLERQDYPARRLSPSGPAEAPYDAAGWTLPYQMGVNLVTVDRPFELPAMTLVSHASIAPAEIAGERRPTHYLIDGRGIGGALAINWLRAAGLKPSLTRGPAETPGHRYGPGTIVVAQSRDARSVVERIASELGLRATAMKGRMPADVLAIGRARTGLYRPWVDNIDEGWTRWLLERYEFPFSSLRDADIRAGGLRATFDVIVLPDASPDSIVHGHRPGTVPPEYAGGLGAEGVAALRAFVEEGGTLVCLDSSGGLAVDLFGLPIADVARTARQDEFLCPGSIVRLRLDETHPLAFGMPAETGAFFAYSSAYELRPSSTTEGHGGPAALPSVQVVARYAEKDLLMSGWLEGEHVIAGRAAAIDARAGRGRVVLIGFRAQHRAQSLATFRLLFNAVLTSP
jgi:hypothetical protein